MTRLGAGVLGLAVALGCGSTEPTATTQQEATTGRLVSVNGRAVWSTAVRITGCPNQITEMDGSFATSCAASTYDVAVRSSANSGIVYQGLTRRAPVLTIPFTVGYDDWVTVSGTIAGRDPSRTGGVALTSAAGGSSGLVAAGTSGAYSTTAYWFHDEAPSATVRALEWTAAWMVGTTGYTAYGAAPVSLAHGTDSAVSPALEPIAGGTLAVSFPAADPYTVAAELWATWPDGGVTRLGSTVPDSNGGKVPTPDLSGVGFAVLATTGSNPVQSAWRRGLPASATVDPIVLPTPAVFTAPGYGADVGATTNFTFDAVPDAVYLVGFVSTVSGGPMLYVVTRETSVRIPDFGWAGFAFPAGVSLTASVDAMGPLGSVDAVTAAPLTFLPARWGPWAGNRIPAVDGFATRSTMPVQIP